MNILVIGHYGIYEHLSASFVHSQAKTYAQLGHNVRVIIPVPLGKKFQGSKLGPRMYHLSADGIDLFYVRYLSVSNYGKKHFNPRSAAAAIRPWLGAILDHFTPDIIHAHTLGLDSGVGRWLKKRLGCPLVVTTHGSDTFVPFSQGQRSMLRLFAQDADQIVCVSTLLQKRLEESGVTQPTRIILNGFRVTQTPRQEKPPVSLAQAGYLVARKKADVTMRAFELISQQHPDATLTIVGSGPEEQRFRQLASELESGPKIRFTGYLSNPQLLEEVSRARFFVMPSVREGFGIVYLEAMANYCVTIGTAGEGISDLIISGYNGFLVPPDDPKAIADTIFYCLKHPEEAETIARRGHDAAVSLTWEKNAREYLELFSELTAGSNSSHQTGA